MGAVYQARQPKLDRLVALKVLPLELAQQPGFAERFLREARALAKLNHPHVVAVYDFGEAEGLYYFLMEFVDGVNLRQAMQAGPLQPAEALRIVAQVCEALQFAHDEGIIHRDVKPENILLDKRGRVKMVDFGLAKLLGGAPTDRALTASRQVMGTWHYMAPEQVETPLAVDHRADVYSLGVVLYEMLTGGLPLGRFALPSQKAAVDGRLDEVILQALEKEPDRRFQHVREMKTAVESVTAGTATAAWQGATTDVGRMASEPEAIRQRLVAPAAGLRLTGICACVFALLFCGAVAFAAVAAAQQVRALPSPAQALALLGLAGLAQGVVVVLGAQKMKEVKAYGFAVLTSVLAMLPLSAAVLIGLPVGIWALVVLTNPEVIAAFHAERLGQTPARRPGPRGRFGAFVSGATCWAIVLCILGAGTVLLPWALLDIEGGMPGWLIHWSDVKAFGFQFWYGLTTTATYTALFVLLLATVGVREGSWLGRPVALLLAGAGVIALTILFLWSASAQKLDATPAMLDVTHRGMEWMEATGWKNVPRSSWPKEMPTKVVRATAQLGPWANLALGAGLVALGALQLRRVLVRPGTEI
jgi:hypothetical protein